MSVEKKTQRLKQIADREHEARLWVLWDKHNKGCIDCRETNPLLLDYDHVGDKESDIADMAGCAREKLEEEVAKCVVRCANCHRLKTLRERGARVYNEWMTLEVEFNLVD